MNFDVVMEDRAAPAKRRESEVGATSTEYAILVSLIAFVLVAGATVFGSTLTSYYGYLSKQIGLGW